MIARAFPVLLFAAASMAHVGSPDTFFSGHAGPYPVRVTVRLPGVIPGVAEISVRLPGTSPETIASVTVRPVQWNLDTNGAPPPEVAAAVSGDGELYAASLWFMTATSYRVLVSVEGRQGAGTAVVPVVALATAQRPLPAGLGVLLAGLAVFLVVGLLTIVGAAARESVLPPGVTPDATRRPVVRDAVCLAALILAAGLWVGREWWNLAAFSYGNSVLYRPFSSEANTVDEAGSQVLTLTIRDDRWPPSPGDFSTRYNMLMPDHGKLMHMFLAREPGLDAFAHVHPVPVSPSAESFRVTVPPLPAGQYRVYADIVHESGYTQTLEASVFLRAPAAVAPPGDADDTWLAGDFGTGPLPQVFRSTDGTVLEWQRTPAPLVEGQETTLTFSVRGPDGAPALLEPYMGMTGHLAVFLEDGSVFAHLHPAGSVSMAALQRFGGGAMDDPHRQHGTTAASELSVPYAFPKAGRYRLWVQVKREGRVVSGLFDATVSAAID